MRRVWEGLGWMLTAALSVAGCAAPNITPRPPKHPEELTLPPLAEAKFSSPPKYPDGTLNQDGPSQSKGGGPPNMSAMNAMSGMGGRGGMGGGMGGGGMGGGGMGGRGY